MGKALHHNSGLLNLLLNIFLSSEKQTHRIVIRTDIYNPTNTAHKIGSVSQATDEDVYKMP
jgi:hypothetical protein